MNGLPITLYIHHESLSSTMRRHDTRRTPAVWQANYTSRILQVCIASNSSIAGCKSKGVRFPWSREKVFKLLSISYSVYRCEGILIRIYTWARKRIFILIMRKKNIFSYTGCCCCYYYTHVAYHRYVTRLSDDCFDVTSPLGSKKRDHTVADHVYHRPRCIDCIAASVVPSQHQPNVW